VLNNRSVPTNILLPHLTYRKLEEAIAWLCSTFEFVEHYRYGDPVSGAQLRFGDAAYVMVSTERIRSRSPLDLGYGTQSLTVFVEDVEAHYARTTAMGASIVEELNQTIYGELQYGVLDLERHHWLFSRHARDVSPQTWGAAVKDSASAKPGKP
jgi:uncharacterized glyoxalase superfamily protein PhnB